jgi:L-iditol 2-dehydrogenase
MSLPDRMRALVLYDAHDLRVEERPVPEPGPGELLVRTRACGICSGDVMAWYVARKAPLVLGHEPAGEVAATGDGDPPVDDGGRPFRPGDRVFVHHHAPCFACVACERGNYVQCPEWRKSRIDPGGIAEYFRVPQGNVRDTLRLPERVAFADAALTEPLACVVKSLRRSGVKPGDTCYVAGLGVMGLMHVLVAREIGARVFGGDFIEERRAAARRCGAVAFDPGEAAEVLGRGADVVVCGPGTPQAMRAAVAAAAPGGTVVMFTPFAPDAPLALDAERFYFADLRLVASYSCGPNDTREALRLIERGVVSAQRLGATSVGLDGAAAAYRDLAHARILKPIVTFD